MHCDGLHVCCENPPKDIHLFTPIKIRGLKFENRIAVSPMCQYAAIDGIPNDYHLVHYGSRAQGGAGCIIAEATGVTLDGRITPGCTTIHTDDHIAPWKRITDFVKKTKSVIGIQLAHAGRKASCNRPWEGDDSLVDERKWTTVAPSAIPFNGSGIVHVPRELTIDEIKTLIGQFAEAARRAVEAGFQLIELHYAHGYLVNEFLSPLSNKRTDEYGGSFENRCRLALEIVEAVRKTIPVEMPLFVRISASEWHAEGWTVDDSILLSKQFKCKGVDLIDCSSGFNVPNYKDIPFGPSFQVPIAERIRNEASILTGAVGFITKATQSNLIINESKADFVIVAREHLRDPYFAYHVAVELGSQLEINDPESLCLPINYSHWIKRKKQQPRVNVETSDIV